MDVCGWIGRKFVMDCFNEEACITFGASYDKANFLGRLDICVLDIKMGFKLAGRRIFESHSLLTRSWFTGKSCLICNHRMLEKGSFLYEKLQLANNHVKKGQHIKIL